MMISSRHCRAVSQRHAFYRRTAETGAGVTGGRCARSLPGQAHDQWEELVHTPAACQRSGGGWGRAVRMGTGCGRGRTAARDLAETSAQFQMVDPSNSLSVRGDHATAGAREDRRRI